MFVTLNRRKQAEMGSGKPKVPKVDYAKMERERLVAEEKAKLRAEQDKKDAEDKAQAEANEELSNMRKRKRKGSFLMGVEEDGAIGSTPAALGG